MPALVLVTWVGGWLECRQQRREREAAGRGQVDWRRRDGLAQL